jgi:ABC-type dipeptide/oligopeptide/nickel transport system permease subunit
VIVEQHAAMRFAWLKEQSGNDAAVEQSTVDRIIFIAYNVIWWIPVVLPLIKVIDYQTGFIAFLVITIIRAIANLVRNNVLKGEQAEYFPFRAP